MAIKSYSFIANFHNADLNVTLKLEFYYVKSNNCFVIRVINTKDFEDCAFVERGFSTGRLTKEVIHKYIYEQIISLMGYPDNMAVASLNDEGFVYADIRHNMDNTDEIKQYLEDLFRFLSASRTYYCKK